LQLLYVISNVVTYLLIDNMLYGNFKKFGQQYASWSQEDNEKQYEYYGKRSDPKPGDKMLPTFGICEVQEAARDTRHMIINRHKIVCEFSQHILYHYVFVMIWFMIIFGLLVGIVGFIHHLIVLSMTVMRVRNSNLSKSISLREFQYLQYIEKHNLNLYREMLDKLSVAYRYKEAVQEQQKLIRRAQKAAAKGEDALTRQQGGQYSPVESAHEAEDSLGMEEMGPAAEHPDDTRLVALTAEE